MKKLIFVTGNAGKLSEAQALMPGAEVRGVPMDFDEPRSNDLTYIARKKAEQAKKWIFHGNPPVFEHKKSTSAVYQSA